MIFNINQEKNGKSEIIQKQKKQSHFNSEPRLGFREEKKYLERDFENVDESSKEEESLDIHQLEQLASMREKQGLKINYHEI